MERSYKKDFLEWKAILENKHGKMIYDNISEVTNVDSDLALGDMVIFRNDYGVTFGPYEVLGFCRPDSWLCPHRYPNDKDCGIVFFDHDTYWFPASITQLTSDNLISFNHNMKYSDTGQFTPTQKKLAKEIAVRLAHLRKAGCWIVAKSNSLNAYMENDIAHSVMTVGGSPDYTHPILFLDCGKIQDAGADDEEYFELGYITEE